MTQRTIEVRIEGRVQGVGFRQATAQQARHSGLTGYAENRTDGSVQVVLQGEAQAVNEVLQWLETGPPGATVARLETREMPVEQHWHEFSTR
ncbi:acylphosphatase [Kushneria sinocarnis]|uniref:acylphosphatase n=1 Tax=Kushneria sinocarnis TaxID=595502 RepID=A0A420WY70_9GAMM|nr:acylphosphatase [Kushneria sinocarnis]RKR06162.1 acylphosphatase [Kushneria sinocarnis]